MNFEFMTGFMTLEGKITQIYVCLCENTGKSNSDRKSPQPA